VAIPSLTVRAAFESDAMDTTPTWDDISEFVISVTTNSGRSNTTEQFGPSTATVVLDNTDGRFDPRNLSGPYVDTGVSEIRPNVRIEVTAVDDATTYYLATVWADSWTIEHSYGMAICTVAGTGGSKFVSKNDLAETAPTGEADRPGDRIDTVLDAVNWPSSWRDIDIGQTELPATTFGINAREHIDAVAFAERGAFFHGPNGDAVFVSRHNGFLDTSRTTPAATFSDAPAHTGPRWSTVAPVVIDDSRLVNEVSVVTVDGFSAVETDTASVTLHGPYRVEYTDVLVRDEIEAGHVASYLIRQYAGPIDRVDSMTVEAIDDGSEEWLPSIEVGLRDLVEVAVTPPYKTIETYQSFVEGISRSISVGSWSTTFTLSPADRFGFTDPDTWLIVGDATDGKIGTGTVAP